MANFCTITIKVRARKGGLLQGAVVSVASCLVSGARSSTYETSATTDSSGVATFTVPQASVLRLSSNDSTDLNGLIVNIPHSRTLDMGIFFADNLSKVVDRSTTGTINGTGVSVVEKGNGVTHQSVFTFAGFPVTVGNTTGVSFGGSKFYDFPEGRLLILGATIGPVTFGLTNAGNATPIAGTMGGDIAIGTTAPDDGTLAGTDVNLIPSTSIDPISGGSAGAPLAASAHIDGTGAALDAYFNILIDDADVANAASDVLEVNGTLTITWIHLGDY